MTSLGFRSPDGRLQCVACHHRVHFDEVHASRKVCQVADQRAGLRRPARRLRQVLGKYEASSPSRDQGVCLFLAFRRRRYWRVFSRTVPSQALLEKQDPSHTPDRNGTPTKHSSRWPSTLEGVTQDAHLNHTLEVLDLQQLTRWTTPKHESGNNVFLLHVQQISNSTT